MAWRGVGQTCGVGAGLGVTLGVAAGLVVGLRVRVGPDQVQYLPPMFQ